MADAAERESVAADAEDVLTVAGLTGDAFGDVSFGLRRGEVLGIAGSNASGKHQIAETIYGLRAPVRGVVTMNGRPLPRGDVKAALRAGIGCVPRGYSCSPRVFFSHCSTPEMCTVAHDRASSGSRAAMAS